MKRVVITGRGVVSPIGMSTVLFWDSLLEGKSGIGDITRFDATKFDSKIAGEVSDFDPLTFLSTKDCRRTPRFVQFALKASDEAIKESGLDLEKIDPYQVGVIIGSGIGSLETVEKEYHTLMTRGPRKLSPFMIPITLAKCRV